MRFFKTGELEDKKIIAALHQAADDYENGELIEVRDLLLDIINAIDNFDPEDVSKMFMNCEKLEPIPKGVNKNRGIRLKVPKEFPNTHNYGRLVTFYCAKCGKQLCACYETDPLRGGGISSDYHFCIKCGNPLDFGEYYHHEINDEIKFED